MTRLYRWRSCVLLCVLSCVLICVLPALASATDPQTLIDNVRNIKTTLPADSNAATAYVRSVGTESAEIFGEGVDNSMRDWAAAFNAWWGSLVTIEEEDAAKRIAFDVLDADTMALLTILSDAIVAEGDGIRRTSPGIAEDVWGTDANAANLGDDLEDAIFIYEVYGTGGLRSYYGCNPEAYSCSYILDGVYGYWQQLVNHLDYLTHLWGQLDGEDPEDAAAWNATIRDGMFAAVADLNWDQDVLDWLYTVIDYDY